MGIRFVLLVNKQGQTRLAQYYEYLTLEERRALEGEIVRKCLTRTDQQVISTIHNLTAFSAPPTPPDQDGVPRASFIAGVRLSLLIRQQDPFFGTNCVGIGGFLRGGAKRSGSGRANRAGARRIRSIPWRTADPGGSRLRAGVDSLRCGRIEPIRSAVIKMK
ncbi:hypothetical protein Taro_033638 [Colocasia esculenta]|uniref:AP complex mu/sigma subunit domain-containing protein n=1 Tax=Colocasia esculenta TaxID=4460 RepID=A0A843W7J9_COLES|nr:hypothetical protein [Colocasia esculenta]